MTPAARLSAAISILDRILAGAPAEQALTNWARASRFAGSGDRNAIRDLVFDAIRCRRSFAALGGGETGRGLILGGLRAAGVEPEALFTGEGHAPPPLSAQDAGQADAVIAALLALDPGLTLMGLAGAPILARARAAGLRVVAEAFADRAYTATGALVSRRDPGAVLHDPALVAARMLRLATDGVIDAADGTPLQLQADSICIHGDSPDAVAMARQIRATLLAHGVTIAPFAP